jgi:phosphohistidine swiveling domain-containing protein
VAKAGRGTNLFVAGTVKGTVRWFHTPADVLSIDPDALGDTVAFVTKGGTTFLAPILPDVRALVCTAGSAESHLAILARDYGIPCVMAAELAVELADGDAIELDLSKPNEARLSVRRSRR